MIARRKAEQLREHERRLPGHYRFLRDTMYGRP
jgi:hypothetical protein